MPKLPERQIIGARVMARLDGRIVPATIVGAAGGRALRKAPPTRELPTTARWRARPDEAEAAGGRAGPAGCFWICRTPMSPMVLKS